METTSDIRIHLRFVGSDQFPARLLLGAIEAVDRALMRAELEEIDELAGAFPEIPSAVFDAMRYRAGQLTAQAINFDYASTGSLILAGMGAAVAYWLLDKTLGETIKESWEESDLHRRLKAFLIKRRGAKAQAIAADIRPSRWTDAMNQVEVTTTSEGTVALIVVTIPVPPDLSPIPSASQIERLPHRRDA